MARRIATVGYYVVLPNLYYRRTREFHLERSEEGMKRMFEMMSTSQHGESSRTPRRCSASSTPGPRSRPGPVGAVGYCMSGPFVVAVAAPYPERFAATASIYGARLITDAPDSAHLSVAGIQGEIYFACAEIDRWASEGADRRARAHPRRRRRRHRIEWYPGAEHGFAFPEREGVYDKPSAERHWERLFALFERNLGARSQPSRPMAGPGADHGDHGSGKSTVAQQVAEQRMPSVHLRGDVFRRMIIPGRAEMGARAVRRSDHAAAAALPTARDGRGYLPPPTGFRSSTRTSSSAPR